MSENGSELDDPGTIDDIDISAVETAIDSLLDNAQQNLGYPFDPSKGSSSKPSTTLNYRFNAEIEVALETDWPLFAGLTLTDIALQTKISKAKGLPGNLFVSLSATAVIGSTTVTVTGSIPRLSTEATVDFLLFIQVQGELGTLNPADLISTLTNNGSKFDVVTGNLDSQLIDQIEGGSEGVSFVASAFIIVTKPVTGSIFLKQLGFSLASDIEWDIVANHISLSDVSLSASFYHDAAGSDWSAALGLSGIVSLEAAIISVKGEIGLGKTPAVNLSLTAEANQEMTPQSMLQVILQPDSGFKYESSYTNLLPPSVSLPSGARNSFGANLSLKKDQAGWYVSAGDITLNWNMMYWYPVPALDISLTALYFKVAVDRATVPPVAQPSDAQITYTAAFGGSLELAGIPLSVVVTYASTTNIMTLTCAVDDAANVSLQDIAFDALLNPSSTPKANDLVAEAQQSPVPESVPVHMEWCATRAWRTNTYVVLTFSDATMTRLVLKADFNIDWQVTSLITITHLGLYFDIINPISDDINSPTIIRGYACGEFTVGQNIRVFAFIAGVTQPTISEFAVGLSITSDSQASLGMSSQTVLADPRFIGQVFDADGWSLPDTFPSSPSIVSTTVTSLNSKMLMKITQKLKDDNSGDYTTAISLLQVTLDIAGTWSIFDNVSLAGISLTVNAIPASASSNNENSYSLELAGWVAGNLSVVQSTSYNVMLVATLEKSASEPLTLFVGIVASYTGHSSALVPLSAFLKMPVTGLDNANVASDPSAQAVPTGLAISPSSLLAGSVGTCSLTVQKIANTWQLQSIEASLTQKDNWVIIPDKLVISQSTIKLLVTNPRQNAQQPARAMKFSASALATVGKLVNIAAFISVALTNGKEDILTVVLSVSKFQDALGTLVGTGVDIPPDIPSLTSANFSATLTIICKKVDTKFQLQKVMVAAVTATPWSLGHFSIESFTIGAIFDNIGPNMTTTVNFTASALISSVNVDLAISYVTGTPSTLTFVITSGIQPTQLVDAFVPGGLTQNGGLNPPSLTADTGLSDYATKAAAQGFVVFKNSGSWSADSLGFVLASSEPEWFHISDIIVAKNLKLTLGLSGLSIGPKVLSLSLNLDIVYQKRPPPAGQTGVMNCSAVATAKQLVITVDTSKCNMPQFLYTVTGGFWNPPDSLTLPSIGPEGLLAALILTIDWDDGYATFQAILKDWNLSSQFPKLLGIAQPRFEATIKKAGASGFTATGQLAGTAIAFGVDIPMSYVLPDGPFLVCGVDVKNAYEMAKRLYNILKDAEEVAAIISELAEFAGVLDVAADVAAALGAAMVAASVIDSLMSKYFSSDSSGGPTPNHDDPSNNSSGNSTGQPAFVLGGKALSPGPADEIVDLEVYAKDKYGAILQPFDSTKLFVQSKTEQNNQENIVVTWSSITLGLQTSFHRPQNNSSMYVQYTGTPSIELSFQNLVQAVPSVFSLANSVIESPYTIGCLSQGLVVLRPRDQYSQFRYGPGAAPTLLIQSFIQNGGSGVATYNASKGFSVRNDSLLLPFSLPSPGKYTLTIADPANSSASRSVEISGVNAIDPNHCIAWGDGLISGPGNKICTIFIGLKDQQGNNYTPADSELPNVHIWLSTEIAELNWQKSDSTILCFYTRPPSGKFSIQISVNDSLIEGGSIYLEATNAATFVSVANSQCSILNNVVAAGDTIEGRLILYDNLGCRWINMGSTDFQIRAPSDAFGAVALTDCLDGTFSFQCLAKSSLGTSSISIVAAKDETQNAQGSPMSINVVAGRSLANVVAYGSGLMQAKDGVINTITVGGKDQYGNAHPLRLGSNCKLIAVCDGQSIPAIAAQSNMTTFAYQTQSKTSNSVLVLLQPLGDAAFHERMYLVPRGDPGVVSPSKSFISWTGMNSGSLPSKPTLYAMNASGQRVFQGGDFVQVTSVRNAPLTLVNPVLDNMDGSYQLNFILPSTIPAGQHPQVQVTLNQQAIGASPVSFPLTPSPIVSAIVSGLDKQSYPVGIEQSFTISCLDAAGHITAQGFQSAAAYILERGTDVPQYLICSIGAIQGGVITVKFTVPADMGEGDYNCHVFINTEPIATSPIPMTVVSPTPVSIDDINEACQITQYTLATPFSRWAMNDGPGWTVAYDGTNDTILTTVASPRSSSNELSSSFSLKLPVTDQWFENGFMFSFDIAVEVGTSFQIAPFTQPSDCQLTMQWTPSNPSSSTGHSQWNLNGPVTIPQTDRLSVTWPSPSTIAFFYLISPDKTQYTIAAFQAGQFMTQHQWPVGSSVPRLGFTIQRLSDASCKVHVSNVVTIPSYWRNVPTGPLTASASDFQVGNEPARVLDGDKSTFWHSEYSPSLLSLPHNITIDLGAVYVTSSLSYLPRQDGTPNGRIGHHTIDLSTDNKTWTTVLSDGNWPDVVTSNVDNWTPQNGRYVRLTAHSEAGNRGPWTSAAEIQIGYTGNAIESAADIDFASPWASKYVHLVNNSGTLDNRGLVMSGTSHPTAVNNPWIYQQLVADYGQSVGVFSLDIPESYKFTPSGSVPQFANIEFAGFYFNPNTGKWVDWVGDSVTDLAAADLVVLKNSSGSRTGPVGKTTNTVFCVVGKECATIFANGLFQITATARTGSGGKQTPIQDLRAPELFSWWTDIVWHKMRAWPALKSAQ